VDMEGLAHTLSSIVERTNDETIIITGHGELSNRRDMAEYAQLLNDSIERVKKEIAAGKTDKEIQEEGLPQKWKNWPAADNVPLVPRLNHMIFISLTDKNLDQ
jgi:cyclase